MAALWLQRIKLVNHASCVPVCEIQSRDALWWFRISRQDDIADGPAGWGKALNPSINQSCNWTYLSTQALRDIRLLEKTSSTSGDQHCIEHSMCSPYVYSEHSPMAQLNSSISHTESTAWNFRDQTSPAISFFLKFNKKGLQASISF